MISLPSAHTLILFVHVVAAALLLGSSLLAPLTRAAIRACVSVGELRGSLAFAARTARPNPMAALLVLASGVYLGSVGWWSSSWFWVAIVAFVVNSALAGAVVKPFGMRMGRMLAGAEGGASVPSSIETLRHARGWDLATDVMLGNDLSVLYLMLRKPDLDEAIAALLLFNGVIAAISLIRRGALVVPVEPAAAAPSAERPSR